MVEAKKGTFLSQRLQIRGLFGKSACATLFLREPGVNERIVIGGSLSPPEQPIASALSHQPRRTLHRSATRLNPADHYACHA